MASFGWPSPNFMSWRYTGWNSDNNVSTGPTTMPEDGTVTQIVYYCAGRLGPINTQGCLWYDTGGLIAAGSVIAAPGGSLSTNGQTWNSSACNVFMGRGQVFTMGWWRNPANGSDCVWSYAGGGTEWEGTTPNSAGAGVFGKDLELAETIGVYIVYTPTVPVSGPPPAPPLPPTPGAVQKDTKWMLLEMQQGKLPAR